MMSSRSFTLTSHFKASSDQVISLVKRPETLFYIARPLVVFRPVDKSLPKEWEVGTYWMRMYLFGIIPLGKQAIVISYPSTEPFKMLDDGHSGLIKKWHHLITVEVEGDGCRYQDQLEIDAGWLTPLVLRFAKLFYRHRQSRWQVYLDELNQEE